MDILPYGCGRMNGAETTMPTLRALAEMGLLVGAAVVVLVLATVVL